MTQLPNHIIELAMQKSFAELSQSEQSEVLSMMSQNDYAELYEGSKISRLLAFNPGQINSSKGQQLELIERLKKRHKNQNFLVYPIAIWKVAASLLLLFFIGAYYLKSNFKSERTVYLTSIDTLYIDKPALIDTIIENIVKHDTVYKNKFITSNASSPQVVYSETSSVAHTLIETDEIKQLKVSTYGALLNDKKGKNIKDDSLIKKIGFSTL